MKSSTAEGTYSHAGHMSAWRIEVNEGRWNKCMAGCVCELPIGLKVKYTYCHFWGVDAAERDGKLVASR